MQFLVTNFQPSKCNREYANAASVARQAIGNICFQGSGSFTTKMLDVTAEGFSSIVPVENAEGKQVWKPLKAILKKFAQTSSYIINRNEIIQMIRNT